VGVSEISGHPLEELCLLPAAQLAEQTLDFLQTIAVHDDPEGSTFADVDGADLLDAAG
jgi:hypothetical protein